MNRSMPGVFISYRRQDSIAYAGRLYDRLTAHFGPEQVFMDIDTLKPGEDFVEVLQSTLASCDVLVAVIGRYWLSAKDENGHLRLEDPEDFVHLEIAAALERGIRIIPALVGGCQMPQPSSLPDPLKKLTRRVAMDIQDTQFHKSVDSLIEVLSTAIKAAQEQRRMRSAQQEQRLVPTSIGPPALAGDGRELGQASDLRKGIGRLAVFTIGGLYAIPRLWSIVDSERTTSLLAGHYAELSDLLAKKTYNPSDKKKIARLLVALGLDKRDTSPFFALVSDGGHLVRRRRSGLEIVANGREDWLGHVKLIFSDVSDGSRRAAAGIVACLNADMLAMVDFEDRAALLSFNEDALPARGLPPYDMAVASERVATEGKDRCVRQR